MLNRHVHRKRGGKGLLSMHAGVAGCMITSGVKCIDSGHCQCVLHLSKPILIATCYRNSVHATRRSLWCMKVKHHGTAQNRSRPLKVLQVNQYLIPSQKRRHERLVVSGQGVPSRRLQAITQQRSPQLAFSRLHLKIQWPPTEPDSSNKPALLLLVCHIYVVGPRKGVNICGARR